MIYIASRSAFASKSRSLAVTGTPAGFWGGGPAVRPYSVRKQAKPMSPRTDTLRDNINIAKLPFGIIFGTSGPTLENYILWFRIRSSGRLPRIRPHGIDFHALTRRISTTARGPTSLSTHRQRVNGPAYWLPALPERAARPTLASREVRRRS